MEISPLSAVLKQYRATMLPMKAILVRNKFPISASIFTVIISKSQSLLSPLKYLKIYKIQNVLNIFQLRVINLNMNFHISY